MLCLASIIGLRCLMRHGWTMLKYGCATRIVIVMPVWYLLPMHTEHIPPLVVERVDTIVIHDTIRLASVASGQSTVASDIPLRKKVTRIQAGYEADIYFPTNEMRILPDHELNRASWMHFVNKWILLNRITGIPYRELPLPVTLLPKDILLIMNVWLKNVPRPFKRSWKINMANVWRWQSSGSVRIGNSLRKI